MPYGCALAALDSTLPLLCALQVVQVTPQKLLRFAVCLLPAAYAVASLWCRGLFERSEVPVLFRLLQHLHPNNLCTAPDRPICYCRELGVFFC